MEGIGVGKFMEGSGSLQVYGDCMMVINWMTDHTQILNNRLLSVEKLTRKNVRPLTLLHMETLFLSLHAENACMHFLMRKCNFA